MQLIFICDLAKLFSSKLFFWETPSNFLDKHSVYEKTIFLLLFQSICFLFLFSCLTTQVRIFSTMLKRSYESRHP